MTTTTTTTTATTTTVVPYSSPVTSGTMLTQTWGLLVDSYRELHHKKLFWITLVLSLLVVAAFAFVGINQTGVTIFTWEIPGVWNTNFIPRDSFYKFLFVNLAIPYWLGVGASALALISVGGIFPDLLTGGSIDLYLAKPISRLRLFLTKYLTSLLFVALQVFVFCAASFLVMGVRGGTWEPGVFLAVPIVTLFFSYLFCVCVLLGIVTRSTLVALLLTVLAWFGLWMFNSADGVLLAFKTAANEQVAAKQRLVEFNERVIAQNEAQPPERRGNVSQFAFQRDRARENLAQAEDSASKLRFWHALIVRVKTPLPKTAETVALLDRWLVNPDPMFAAEQESHARRETRRAQRRAAAATTTTTNAAAAPGPPPPPTTQPDGLERYMELPETKRQISEEVRGRSVAWVVGTSLGFEAVVLALAAWVFCRRDY